MPKYLEEKDRKQINIHICTRHKIFNYLVLLYSSVGSKHQVRILDFYQNRHKNNKNLKRCFEMCINISTLVLQ